MRDDILHSWLREDVSCRYLWLTIFIRSSGIYIFAHFSSKLTFLLKRVYKSSWIPDFSSDFLRIARLFSFPRKWLSFQIFSQFSRPTIHRVRPLLSKMKFPTFPWIFQIFPLFPDQFSDWMSKRNLIHFVRTRKDPNNFEPSKYVWKNSPTFLKISDFSNFPGILF